MHRPRNSLANVTFYATIKAVPGANGGRWAEFTPSQTLTINSGDFLIGFSIDSSVSTKPAALDTNSPQKRSWVTTDNRTARPVLDAFKADGNLGIRALATIGN